MSPSLPPPSLPLPLSPPSLPSLPLPLSPPSLPPLPPSLPPCSYLIPASKHTLS